MDKNKNPSILSGTVFDDTEKAGDFLLQEVQKILSDVTGEEFTVFIAILTKVKSISSNPQNLADIITEQAELDKDFQPLEPESLDRLICCTRQASPFFIKGASPTKFLEYLFGKVLPVLNDIVVTDVGDYKYEVIKLLAELSVYASVENANKYTEPVYNKLMEYMPLPPDGEESEADAIEKLNFSFTECFLYTLHKLGSKNQEFLKSAEAADKLKDFRLRLGYFGRMVQVYIKQLRATLQTKASAELEESENKVKVMALKTCNNINIIIKDLLHNPPSYKANIAVSWKSKAIPIITSSDESIEERRKRAGITPISLDNLPAKKERSSAAPAGEKGKVYAIPPSRKGIAMDEEYTPRRQSWGSNRRNSGGAGGNRRGGGGGGGWNRNRKRGANRQKEHENFLMR